MYERKAWEDDADVGPPSVSEESSETDDVTEERERISMDDAEMGEEEKRTAQIRDIMDAVERVLCCLLYDRCVPFFIHSAFRSPRKRPVAKGPSFATSSCMILA